MIAASPPAATEPALVPELHHAGGGLVRPECVLATADGRLYTKADLANRFARLKAQWSNPLVDMIMTETARMALARFREAPKPRTPAE